MIDHNSVDAHTAIGVLQILPVAVLTAVARGEVDLNILARYELASRGLGRAGTWIGFPAAAAEAAADLRTDTITRGDGRTVRVSVPE